MTVEPAVAPAAAASWRLLAEALEAEADPLRRHMLEVVADHVDAEVRGDIARLMATLVEDPRYHFWGGAAGGGPKGAAAVEAHYRALVASGLNRLEFEISRLVPGADCVVTEGVFRHAVKGALLAGQAPGDDVDPDTWYLVEYQALVIWVFDDDCRLLVGEDIYFGGEWSVEAPLAPGDRPHLGPVDRDLTSAR